jgi:hypothetical protein
MRKLFKAVLMALPVVLLPVPLLLLLLLLLLSLMLLKSSVDCLKLAERRRSRKRLVVDEDPIANAAERSPGADPSASPDPNVVATDPVAADPVAAAA